MGFLRDWTENNVRRNLRLGAAQTLSLARDVIPNLGVKGFTLEDARAWCRDHNIHFTRHRAVGEWVTAGVCSTACCRVYGAFAPGESIPAAVRRAAKVPDGYDVVYVSPDLEGVEAVVVAFHEVAHRTLHGRNPKIYNGDPELKARAERQASIVGDVAGLPKGLVRGLSAEEIQERFNIRPELAQLRAEILFWE